MAFITHFIIEWSGYKHRRRSRHQRRRNVATKENLSVPIKSRQLSINNAAVPVRKNDEELKMRRNKEERNAQSVLDDKHTS